MKSFPRDPEQLTTDWLTNTLGFDVNGFEVVFFSEGTGVMSWVMRILLDSPAGKLGSVIAKFPSKAAANRDGAKRYDMYSKEVDFYKKYVADISVRVPKCYFAEYDEDENEFVVLLEDLTDWEIGDQTLGCSLEQAKSVVSTLAVFHASGWQPSQYPALPSHGGQQQIEGMQSTYPIGWPVVLQQFGEFVPESVRAAAEQIPEHIPDLLAKMCEEPVCFTHADMRLDNIFFKDGQVAIVDWQSICTSAPEQDLAYFLTQSVPAAVRQQEDLVAFYHAELTKQGIVYDLERCRERYVISALYLICYAVVIAGTLDLGNERGQLLGRTIIRNTFSALIELDAFSLIAA